MSTLPGDRRFGRVRAALLVFTIGPAGCSDATSPHDWKEDLRAVPAAASVRFMAADEVTAIGSQVLLTTEVTDGEGNPAADASVSFSTPTPDVLSVSQSGGTVSATALAEGLGWVIARTGNFADTARIMVVRKSSATASAAAGAPFQLLPDEMLFDRPNSMWFVSATYTDASGSRAVKSNFRSTNQSIVRIDENGWVRSLTAGTALIIGRYNGAVDSVRVQVGGAQVATLTLKRDTASISKVGDAVRLYADVLDAGGRLIINPAVTWTSLDPQIATVSGDGGVANVQGRAKGTARVVARKGTRADTGIVQIGGTRNPGVVPTSIDITPAQDTIAAPGGTVQLAAVIRDSGGQLIQQAAATWTSLDPAIATVGTGGPSASRTVTGVKAGSARIAASTNGISDTAAVIVGSSQQGASWTLTHNPANPTTKTPVTISVSASSPAGIATVDISVGGSVVKSCRGATCSHSDSYAAGSYTYSASARDNNGVSSTATPTGFVVTSAGGGPGSGAVPSNLLPTIGPLMSSGSGAATQALDAMFLKQELKNYATFVAQAPNSTGILANHYGALRSRIQWAIRNGQPYGSIANNTAQHAYARGRRIVLHYLQSYAGPNRYSVEPHNNTALADIEVLWWLERLPDAWNHIWTTAHRSMSTSMGRFSMQIGEPRQIAVPLQAYSAAHRMGIPFKPSPYSSSTWNDHKATSWRDAGEKQIAAVLAGGNVLPGGAVHSYDHASQCGKVSPCEAYFMNAMLATELLRWHGFVSPNPKALGAARSIVDHLIVETARKRVTCLPYLSSDSGCAADLAAFYVWPALVLWQETGDVKYRSFALQNINAAQKAWVVGTKQFNQTFSTGVQTAEALLGGMSWH